MDVILITLVTLFCIILYRLVRNIIYKMASFVPGTTVELPSMGVAHSVDGSTNEDIMDYLQYISYKCMKHDGLIKCWLGFKLYFMTLHPLDVEEILKTNLEKDDSLRFLQNLIGYNSTAFASVRVWRERRKTLAPALGPRIVDKFIDTFVAQSESLAAELSFKTANTEFDIWPYINRYTLGAVCESTLGINVNSQKSQNIPMLTALNQLMYLIVERIYRIWLQPDWLYKFFPQYKLHEKCIKTIHDFTDAIIRKKREDLAETSQEQANLQSDEFLKTYTKKSFLDLLISSSSPNGGKGYSDYEIREEVLGLIVAGVDTSAVSVANTLLLLGKYPHIQEKVYEELHDVFYDSDRRPVKEDLIKLEYLERVIKESLRLLPPAPFILRKIQKELRLPSGRSLPAGASVVISIWGLLRDRKYWGPEANSFDPDRFLPERYNLKYPCSFIPFSHGVRNCVGYKYGMTSMKVVLSTILRRYKVVAAPEPTPIPRIRVKLDIMMKPLDGYKVSLEKR